MAICNAKNCSNPVSINKKNGMPHKYCRQCFSRIEIPNRRRKAKPFILGQSNIFGKCRLTINLSDRIEHIKVSRNTKIYKKYSKRAYSNLNRRYVLVIKEGNNELNIYYSLEKNRDTAFYNLQKLLSKI